MKYFLEELKNASKKSKVNFTQKDIVTLLDWRGKFSSEFTIWQRILTKRTILNLL